ncbi:RND family transporter [Mycobacterium sp. CBMA293]|uniref:MMPL/RND family transporter n=1 Tax=unclassified Mycolicibacterium TaxID=2636767 RepID=UPI0012DC27FC|nr:MULTISPECIES: RND family transporter [unclassified Mycolicibacterium]MUL46654.1 RND family transporter [Mycolicibacterium sp. CBMA 360]MUL59045.1 RND family transporter [Mycolicibacterium sp. CBMA 335]MUL69439.1 RND family transporter [Mycolicibacterium sp. CBMA 311]MUL94403.1 RND family transporter [Mycolicibacterium sp. CBMA 230]MUM06580.1 MMPL family RND transporter [Mycolicibacterium sp. CBMA 213]
MSEPTTAPIIRPAHGAPKRPLFARTVRLLAIPIIVFWALLAVVTNTFVPKIEDVAQELAGPMVPTYAPSQVAMLTIGKVFHESTSTSLTMLVLEADRGLTEQDRDYYAGLVRTLNADTTHVQYVMDTWGKPITAAGAQSLDGKSAYVLLRLAGDIGQMQANDSVNAVRHIVDTSNPPAGLKVYVSGAAPLAADTVLIANSSLNNITIATMFLIIFMLLMVYRSVVTMLVPFFGVILLMLSVKGVISAFGHYGIIPLSSFATNMVISLTLGAGTDYGIFLIGRYHEARLNGESREDAYYTAYKGVSHVIIGSGLTIAGACACLTFARLNYFHTMGPAVAVSMLITIAGALTIGPALLSVGSLFGLFDPKQAVKAKLYRRIGTAVVRWPKPILVASVAVVSFGAVFVPTYQVSYDDRTYQPPNAPANEGFQAADRHFPKSKLFSEMLMVESDHDMRNSADFISLDRVAKALIRLQGVAMVQSITRPMGRALEHASIPYLFTTQGSGNGQQLPFTQHNNENTAKQAKITAHSIEVLKQTADLTQRLADELHSTVLTLEDMQQVTEDMRDAISNLDDFMRPLRAYFYWEPHCYDIPVCWSFRSLFDVIDKVDNLAADIGKAVGSFQVIDSLMPQMVSLLRQTVSDNQALLALIVNNYGPTDIQNKNTDQTFDDMINVGNDFDASRSDDFFYIPREAFDNDDIKTGMALMMSPDGHAARFIVTHEGNAMGPEGIEHVKQFPDAIKIALKETSLAGSKIYIGGSGSNNLDIQTYARNDLLIAAIAAFVLIFLIMMIITRSLVAALVIPGTVAFSYAGAFGLSVLIWQHIIGLHLHWLILPLTFIVLVAVGSDYNLLLVARLKEEVHAGLNTGLIRALGSTGGVVTSAGLVFAFTMLAMLSSDLRTIGQMGSTVCIGLLLDTLVVRSFIVPCLVRLLGPWFWWPTFIRQRPLQEYKPGVMV